MQLCRHVSSDLVIADELNVRSLQHLAIFVRLVFNHRRRLAHLKSGQYHILQPQFGNRMAAY